MALVGWWPLNGTLEDNSINKNTLINSGASVALSGPLGKCYELIEASDKLTCGPNDTVSSWFNIKPFSVAAWVYFNSTDNANYGIFTIGTAATEQMLHIVKRNNKLYYGFYDDDCQSNITFTANTWYHVVCTWDSVTRDKRIYINGILDTQTTSSGYLNVPENSQLYIGSYTGLSAPINGKICDVRVYNHVLSVKEIKELAKCKVLHYTFNQFQEPTTNLWVTDLGLPTNVLINDNSTTSFIQPFYTFSSITTADAGRKYSISLDYEILMNDTLDVVLYFQVQKYLGDVFKNAIWTKYIYYSNGVKGKIIDTFTIPPNDGTWDTIKIKYSTALKTDGVDYNSKVCTVQLSNIQIEKKDHATPFVDGSRTGKVYDCSGYNNNADLTEDTTPKWVEGGPVGSGYYEFNGNNNITLPYKIFNDNINQRWTVCGWAYLEDNTIPNQYLNNFNLGNKLVHSSDGRGLLYINSGANDAYTYTNGAVPTKNWFHIAYVLNTDIQRCDIYINGELNASSTNYTKTDVPYGFSTSTVFGTNLVGKLSDIRIYGTDLSSDDIRELYQTRVSVDRDGNLYSNEIVENLQINSNTKITVCSAGFDDGNIAWVKINDSGNLGYNNRGVNVTVLSPKNFNSHSYANFDLYSNDRYTIDGGSTITGTASDAFVSYMSDETKVPYGYLVSMAVRDAANDNWGNVRNLLVNDYNVEHWSGRLYRDSWAYLGIKGVGKLREVYYPQFSGRAEFDHYITTNPRVHKTGQIETMICNSIGPTNGLVLYMPLNGNTKDYSGNKYDGVNYGATVVQGLGNKLAYEFDGNNNYILINNGIFYSSNINPFTLHFVFKRYGTSSNECLLCSRTTLGYGVSVFLLNNGYIRFDTASTSQMYQWSTNKRIAEGQEVTIDCVYTPGNKYLYINGVLEASITSAPTTLGYLSQNFTTIGMSQINGSSYGNPLGGRLQDIRIYNRALSPQEISWLYDMYNPNKNTGAKVFNNNIIYADSFKEGY